MSGLGFQSSDKHSPQEQKIHFDETAAALFDEHCKSLNGKAAGIDLDQISRLVYGYSYTPHEFATFLSAKIPKERNEVVKEIIKFPWLSGTFRKECAKVLTGQYK